MNFDDAYDLLFESFDVCIVTKKGEKYNRKEGTIKLC